jgi:hypothetical protein
VARARTTGRVTVETPGLFETLKAFQGLERDLRSEANAELRGAARACAARLVVELQRAAAACGVPVAPLVAAAARVKSDRIPVVTIGGARRVGRHGTPAGRLAWGSEQGSKSSPDRFAAALNPAGYWIAPTVERFARSDAVAIYRRAIVDLQRRHGLI